MRGEGGLFFSSIYNSLPKWVAGGWLWVQKPNKFSENQVTLFFLLVLSIWLVQHDLALGYNLTVFHISSNLVFLLYRVLHTQCGGMPHLFFNH